MAVYGAATAIPDLSTGSQQLLSAELLRRTDDRGHREDGSVLLVPFGSRPKVFPNAQQLVAHERTLRPQLGQLEPAQRGRLRHEPDERDVCRPIRAPGSKGNDFTQARNTKFAEITDGTSNTMLIGEIRTTSDPNVADCRGDFHNVPGPRFCFMTVTGPNSTIPDQCGQCSVNPVGMPCLQAGGPSYVAARSLHPGGVNVALCDGSVRFVADTVDLRVWRAAGSMNGGEAMPLE